MSDSLGKKKVLGRGLSALLDQSGTGETSLDVAAEHATGSPARIPVDRIEPNPFQPRTHFSENDLHELALSITEYGIIQPLTLRKIDQGRFQVIAGERRLKAAIIAGLQEVPAYIRLANDEQMLEIALVENIQRTDLNPLEVAISFQRLLEECKIKQEDLSQKVGKDRSTISNYIRLLKLPTEIQVAVRDNLISMGHARALINVGDERSQLMILQQILEGKLSVRQVEESVRNLTTSVQNKTVTKSELTPKLEQARSSLSRTLQSKVELKLRKTGSGTITIRFRSEEDLDRIIAKFES